MVKTHVNVQRTHKAQKSEGFKTISHRLMQTKKIGPVLNVGIVTILDVPGIEVHVLPSLRILISRRGHESL